MWDYPAAGELSLLPLIGPLSHKYSQQPGVADERLELKGGDAVRYDDNNHANDDVGITYAFYLKHMQPSEDHEGPGRAK